MCSEPLDPGGEVRGCPVRFTIGMSDILPLRDAPAMNVHRRIVELKKTFSSGRVLGAAGFRFFFLYFIVRTIPASKLSHTNCTCLYLVLHILTQFTIMLSSVFDKLYMTHKTRWINVGKRTKSSRSARANQSTSP